MTKRTVASSVTLRASLLALLALTLSCVAPTFFFVASSYQCPTVRVSYPEREDEGEEVRFTARVNDMPSGRTPTYSWRVSAGRIIGRQDTQRLKVDSTGLGGRSISAVVSVGNIDAPCPNTARGRTRIRTDKAVRPNMPPTVGLAASSSRVVVAAECTGDHQPNPNCTPTGTTVQISALASDPDGDTLFYTYSTDAGRITGDGPNATLDLTGVAPGTYTVRIEVDDGCDCPTSVASSSITITVERCDCVPRPAPPQKPEPGSPVKPVSRALREFAPLVGGGVGLE